MTDQPDTPMILADEGKTFALGQRLAALLGDMTTVSLRGELGAGKTLLARGFARGLGIREPVTSPTFAIVQEYSRPDGRWLYHLDMYRISDEEAGLAFGIEDYLFPDNGISLVEWPERIEGLLRSVPPGGRHVRVRLEHAGGDRRQVILPTFLTEKLGKLE